MELLLGNLVWRLVDLAGARNDDTAERYSLCSSFGISYYTPLYLFFFFNVVVLD